MPTIGSVQLLIGALFLVLTLGVVAVLIAVARHSGDPALPYARVSERGYLLRRYWFIVVVSTAVLAFAISLFFLPYPSGTQAGKALQVRVVGYQYYWLLSTSTFHTGQTVDFAVTSGDVNHGYGLYDPHGVLIAQVQAMPGYVNHLIVTFHAAGTYTVRCMEYCGKLHHVMELTFTVTGGNR
jgi:cytochrome c oxidase subunit 2